MILLTIRLRASWRRFLDWLKTVCRDYRHATFRKADLSLRSRYFWRSPYAVSKAYLLARGDLNPYQYGETPLATLSQLTSWLQLRPGDKVYELGCGMGLTAFWLRLVAGCSVVGIEQVPAFVNRAQQLANRLGIEGLEFRRENMTCVNYADADLIYLYGTCLEDEVVKHLIGALESLKPEARVVTVSYPLTDYAPDAFVVVDQIQATYTWGKAQVYVQKRRT